MQANAMPYQPEPDGEIRLWCDILLPCNISHSLCGIAGMDEKRRHSRYWMILRNVSYEAVWNQKRVHLRQS